LFESLPPLCFFSNGLRGAWALSLLFRAVFPLRQGKPALGAQYPFFFPFGPSRFFRISPFKLLCFFSLVFTVHPSVLDFFATPPPWFLNHIFSPFMYVFFAHPVGAGLLIWTPPPPLPLHRAWVRCFPPTVSPTVSKVVSGHNVGSFPPSLKKPGQKVTALRSPLH